MAQLAGALERGDRLGDVPAPDVKRPDREEPGDDGLRVADRLGQVQRLARHDLRFRKAPELGE